MGQNEVKPLNERSIYLNQIRCANQNKVITGVMVKGKRIVDDGYGKSQQKMDANIGDNSIQSKIDVLGERTKEFSNQTSSGKTAGLNNNVTTTNGVVKGIRILKENQFNNPSDVLQKRQSSTFRRISSISSAKSTPTAIAKYPEINSNLKGSYQPASSSAVDVKSAQQQQQMQVQQQQQQLLQTPYRRIIEEDDNENIVSAHTNSSQSSGNNQISNFHRIVTDTIQKDQYQNQTLQTLCRESVRNRDNTTTVPPFRMTITQPTDSSFFPQSNTLQNNYHNNLGGNTNASILERFSVNSAAQQRRMSTRNSYRDQDLNNPDAIYRLQQLRSKQPVKNGFLSGNIDFMELFMKLPENVQRIILYFLFEDAPALKLVNSLFYYKIDDFLESEMVQLDNSFIKNTMCFLTFKDSYLTQTPMRFRDIKGIKYERHLIAEVLPAVKGYSVKISFSCKYSNSACKKKNSRYVFEYQFDAVPDQKVVWAFKEDCRHNFDAESHTFLQPITPVRIGDNVKISINFFSLAGMLDLSTIKWLEPVFTAIPDIPIMMDPNDLMDYEANRICEIEYLYTSWFLFGYFHSNQKCKLDFFEPFLHLKETRCAGVDLITTKLIFEAAQPGIVPKSLENFGIRVKIIAKGKEATCTVKRLGVFSDNESTLELKVGDTFVFYISKGD